MNPIACPNLSPSSVADRKFLSRFTRASALLLVFSVLAGCGKSPYPEPTIDQFGGQLTHMGNSVTFDADERVVLRLVLHTNGERFGVPIRSDGSFDVGWMPIGEYSATLERTRADGGARRASRETYNVASGFTIEEGRTEYEVELGEGFKP